MPARLLLALVLLVCALAPSAADAQTTWPVDATGITPNSTLTINESIALASPGDTIAVAPGLYVETVDFAGKDLIVQSTAGPATTTIVGTSYAVRFHTAESPAAQLDGFQLQTASTRGISIAGGASPTITNCTLLGVPGYPIYIENAGGVLVQNTTVDGGTYSSGVYVTGSTATFTGLTVTNRTASTFGTIVVDGGSVVSITGSTFTGNDGGAAGGAIHVQQSSSVTVTDSTFTGNVATSGAVLSTNGAAGVVFRDNLVFDNASGQDGGALYLAGVPRGFVAGNRFVENHAADDGGAMTLVAPARIAVLGNTFVGNSSADKGGGGGGNSKQMAFHKSSSTMVSKCCRLRSASFFRRRAIQPETHSASAKSPPLSRPCGAASW